MAVQKEACKIDQRADQNEEDVLVLIAELCTFDTEYTAYHVYLTIYLYLKYCAHCLFLIGTVSPSIIS